MSLKDDIEALKVRLQTSEEFGDVWSAFFDMANTQIFMSRSKRIKKPPLLRMILLKIGEQIFHGPGTLQNLELLEVQPYHLLHGRFSLHNHVGTVIYFRDIDMGMAAIIKSLHTHEMHYTRFTLFATTEKPEGFFHVPKSKGGH